MSEFSPISPQDGPLYAFVVSHDAATDRRLSAMDLATYIRCLWLFDICGHEADAEWLIAELALPAEETRQSMRNLAELGYLRTPATKARDMAEWQRRRDAVDELGPLD
ncbi:hypothetical protein [Streptomyces sp. NBC_01207]|uniref:hypothetical protein n=1 Tax=Streptomyces sp. NBC_01207 TaxID=2903772 RepID=UPI002E0E19BA|nr:hypothetical protein OG457_27220 [Streptomyces sp. NBC_01207]